MSDLKQPPAETMTTSDVKQPLVSDSKYVPPGPPPRHPSTTAPPSYAPSTSAPTSAPTSSPAPSSTSFLKRGFSKNTQHTAGRFVSAYAETLVGMSPLWLMGEALTGQKPGTKFSKGKGRLVVVAEEVREVVKSSARDVVVIVEQKRKKHGDGKAGAEGGEEVDGEFNPGKVAEVIRAAGENAVLVVTTSLEKVQAELTDWNLGPQLQKVRAKNGRDVIVVLDKALKHPVVVTGVANFARSKGIPHGDALLRLGSLALARILRAMPPEAEEKIEEKLASEGGVGHAQVEEIDANELERTSSFEETEEARVIGEQGRGDKAPGAAPEATPEGGDAYEQMRKRNDCIVM